MTPTIVKDIIISDKVALTKVEAPQFPVKAIIINHGDHAYTKVRYDEATLKCFENDLDKISDYLERAIVWRHLWNLVMDAKMSSLQFFNFAVKQLPHETVEQTLTTSLGDLANLVNNYISLEKVRDCHD
jgi:aminopeptidase N